MAPASAKRVFLVTAVKRACVRKDSMASDVTGGVPAMWTTLSAVTPCLESVPASQAGRDSTVMRRVLLDSMGKLANRSAAARMGLTVTV